MANGDQARPDLSAEREAICHRWSGWRTEHKQKLTAPAVGSIYWLGLKR